LTDEGAVGDIGMSALKAVAVDTELVVGILLYQFLEESGHLRWLLELKIGNVSRCCFHYYIIIL
jgi:hypothetical protein